MTAAGADDRGPGYAVAAGPDGRTLVVNGPWSDRAATRLRNGDVETLILNRELGFSESGLNFIEDWPLRTLRILDWSLGDSRPVERLAGSLESLSIEVAPKVAVNLGAFPRLRSFSGEWKACSATIEQATELRHLSAMTFGDQNLNRLRGLSRLTSLRVMPARTLTSLNGLEELPVADLWIQGAPRLSDISAVVSVASSLTTLRFEACRRLRSIADVSSLDRLEFLEIGDCGEIATLEPLQPLECLTKLYAWGDTKILDGDLSRLRNVTALKRIRMMSRRSYTPSLESIREELSLDS